ncbi:MAG: flagellar hook-length control protein FliK [Deltaproteobacteria bacterium]|nr:flagellar hook-length control protein FliK [Deltaproteobacteria bacterium]
MQLTSLLGIGAEPEVNAKNGVDTNSSNGVDAGFLSLLVGLSSVQQMPLTAEPIIKNDGAEANNVEETSLSGSSVKAENPINMSFIDESAAINGDSAVKVNNEAAPLADNKNKADNALNIPLTAEPIIKTDSAEANNIEGVSLVGNSVKAENPLNIPLTAEPIIKTDSAEANNIEGTSLVDNSVKAENPLNTAPFFAENRLLGNMVFGDAIRNLVQVKENSNADKLVNKLGDAKANQLSIAETDETIAIDTVKSAVTIDELSRQDFIKGYKPILISAPQDTRLVSHSQLPTPNGLSPNISKPSPNLSTDVSESEDTDADIKLLPQSNSSFKNIGGLTTTGGLAELDVDVQKDVSRLATHDPQLTTVNAAVIDAGGIGKTKDILTIGKGEAHSQVDNKAVETQVVEKTAQGIRVIATDGGGRMKISLYPESLGHIRIDVSVNNDGIVNARMVTENSQVKDVIDNNIARLKDSLLQQGLKIDQFSVSVDQQKQSDFSAYEKKMFWHRNPEQEMLAGYNMMTHDPRLAAHDSRLAMGNVDIFV